MKNFLKKLKFLVQLLDGVWSVPLGFIIFWISGLLLSAVFGYGTGTYDPGFIQPLFLAATIVIGATNIALLGLYFSFRGLYRYLYGQKKTGANGQSYLMNYSKKDWLELKVTHRFLIAFLVFFFYVTATIIIYCQLI